MRRFLPMCCVALLLNAAIVQADNDDDTDDAEKKMKDSVGNVIKIFLGTTYSGFPEDAEVKDKLTRNTENTFFDIKRGIRRKCDDKAEQSNIKNYPFEEALASDAIVHVGVLGGEEETGDLLDRTPLTLGIETVGGLMAKLIPRNTVMPTSMSQIFSTAADNQTTVTIKVFEGERPLTKYNHLLGKFGLKNIPPAPKGEPQIEVTFEIDVNGILRVTAEDKETGNKEKITITNDDNRLTPEDIERMTNDAAKFADEDSKLTTPASLGLEK